MTDNKQHLLFFGYVHSCEIEITFFGNLVLAGNTFFIIHLPKIYGEVGILFKALTYKAKATY